MTKTDTKSGNALTVKASTGTQEYLVDGERLDLVREAAQEIEALALTMIGLCGLDRLEFRGMAARIAALSVACYSGIGDPDETPETLRFRLFCPDLGRTTGST